jgi:hypothetical protein
MLSRRTALISGFSALALPGVSQARQECSAPFGNRECMAGLQIGAVETARQRCGNWCWAACIETVFALNGFSVPQERIVEKVFGTTQCLSANGDQILHAIGGPWVDENGRRFEARGSELTWAGFGMSSSLDRPDDYGEGIQGYRDLGAIKIVNTLKDEYPLIVGSIPPGGGIGHAMLLTAVRYSVVPHGGQGVESIRLRSLIVRDPWPDNPNRRELDESEVRGAVFGIKITVR